MKNLILFCVLMLFMKSTICDAATASISGPSYVCAGDNFTLTASLSGCGGCTITNYQWKKWGVNIGTNSSTYNVGSFSISDTGSYTVVISYTGGGGSPITSSAYHILLTPNSTVTLTSAAGTDNQTVCINSNITQITYSTTGATGILNNNIAGANGLPAGVAAQWASNTITISGISTSSGNFNYSIPLTGGCGNINATGTIHVAAINTTTAASHTPTLCINTAISPNITHSTTGATGIGAASGLPAGVSTQWASNTITVSGTPTASGTFNYSIPLSGGCGNVNATGTINVTAANTTTVASSTPTLCINTPISPNITHATTGATGIGTATGLPNGVTAQWSSNSITISGTPTTANNFIYSIPLTGGCGNINASGTINVIADNTASAASSTPNLCINTTINPDITHTTTGATGIGTAVDLPNGVSAQWSANTITIGGTPTESGTFNYSIPLTGGCGSINATGSIIVGAAQTISWNSGSGTQNQTLCAGAAIIPIVFTYGGSAESAIVNVNPPGSLYNTVDTSLKTVTIFGNPDTIVNYTVSASGSVCNQESLSGTITVPYQDNLNDIVAKTNQAGEPYILIYPNPSSVNMYYQWYENGVPIDGANEQFFYPPRYNQTLNPLSCYKVFVISGSYYNCGNFTNCYFMPSGKKFRMTIFPNPSDGIFHLKLTENINISGSHLTIYSLEGKIVHEQQIDNLDKKEINLTMVHGFYLVELITSNGDKFIEKLAIR